MVHYGNSLPYSIAVDPSSEFEPGMAAQISLIGNQVVCGVSDGSAPFGIIDDMKKNAFHSVAIDEVVVTGEIAGVEQNGTWVTPYDVKVELVNPNVTESSFISKVVDVELTARNGVVTFLAGTELNFSLAGTGTPDAIRTVVSYTYQIPNVPGDDSTAASGRMTVWYDRMIVQTDQFETNRAYPLNHPVYVSQSGLFTTTPVQENYPAVGIVFSPPTSIYGSLEILWF